MEILDVTTYSKGFRIEWQDDKNGFGEITVSKTEDGFIIDSECMGDEFCKKVFSAFVDKYISNEFKDEVCCDTCRWWGKKTHEIALSTEDFNQKQIERELKTKKRCLTIEKDFDIDAVYVDYEFEKTQYGNIYTPPNFRCKSYLKMKVIHLFEDYLQGVKEIFERKCNLKVDVKVLKTFILGTTEPLLFFDLKENVILYDAAVACFINKECGKQRCDAVKWLTDNIPSFEDFKEGKYIALEELKTNKSYGR